MLDQLKMKTTTNSLRACLLALSMLGPTVSSSRYSINVVLLYSSYSKVQKNHETIGPDFFSTAHDFPCYIYRILKNNMSIQLQADPPDPSKIREEDIIGVTVLLLTCSYMGQEFMRVGYYVNNDYDDEQLREEPPAKVLIDRVQRNILADKPRVTKFPINFHPEPSTGTGQQQQEPQAASPENHTGNGHGNGDGSKPEADQ